MAIALRILVGLVGLVALLFLIGAALPRNHRATSSVTLTKAPADVWAVVRDLGALQGTWSELKSARRLPDQAGKEVWEQNAGGFAMRLIVEESAPPARLVTRIDAGEKAAFGGTWTYALEPAAGGTRVSVTEDGFVTNPFFRVMMKAMGTHRTLDGYLRALAVKLGETAEPVHQE